MRSYGRAVALAIIALLALRGGAPAAGKPKPKKKAPARARVVNDAPRGQTALERQLQDDLDRILGWNLFARASNGVYVIDLTTGRVLYSYGADRQLNPASNVKLVATATALDALGPDFTFQTRLVGPAPDAAGVVNGDLYLVGSADPTLARAHLAELAAGLRERGVVRVTGDVVVGEGEGRDSLVKPKVSVTVVGGEEPGDIPAVSVEPDSAFFVVENTSVTAKKPTARRAAPKKAATKGKKKAKKGKQAKKRAAARGPAVDVGFRVAHDDRGDYIVVQVSGKLGPGERARVVRPAPRPALFTAHTLRADLLLAGIDVTGGVRRGPAPDQELVELAVHDSVPLGILAAMVNKPSSNFLAERVIEATGAQLYGGEPSNSKGVRAMQEWLERIGVSRGSYRLDNGSGLSYTNHLSARQIAEILVAAANDFRIGPDFLASLAVGGRDGTLKRRFRNGSRGWVRGKTGTLTGVIALSGFVSVGGDETICFAIMTNKFRNRRKLEVRAGHAAMVESMYAFLRRRAEAETPGEVPAVTPPPDEPPPIDEPPPNCDDEPAIEETAPEDVIEPTVETTPAPAE